MVVIGLCLLGIVLGAVQNGARTHQRVDRVGAAIRFFIDPLAMPLSRTTRATSDFFVGLLSARRLAEENRRLRELELPLALYSETLDEKDKEIDRLRTLGGFGSLPGHKRVPATVYGFSINENRLTLNVGSAEGVKLGCPVECADGLVGTVEEVESHECQVLLLTSAGLQTTSTGKTQLIGAIDVNRNPPLDGVVRGENASMVSMQFEEWNANVQIGDLIVTSGYSGRIPRNLIVGKVMQVERNEAFGTLKARIDPKFSVGNLDLVFVLV